MRNDELIDPQVAAELDAIDAVLAGEPVEPRYAELAELSLLLVAERPEPSSAFAGALDARVQRRFASEPRTATSPRARPRALWAPLAGLATAGVAAVVAIAVLGSGSGSSGPEIATTARDLSAASRPRAAAGPSRASSVPSQALTPDAGSKAPDAGSKAGSPQTFSSASTASSSSGALGPVPNGRKITQSAQLALSTPSAHIDDVAQEVFDVVGRENGVVNSSQITASANGYAQFQLSIPSSALAATMNSLSDLRYATVSSRTDNTQDVNGQYLYDQRVLADARALRTSLLKQLANATTQAQINSLTAQIHDAEASINSDEATLRNLNHQIDFSQVTVTINSGGLTPAAGSSSFTLGKAAHDAGRVLTVAAGVALITLAALLPVALVGALAAWVVLAVRRRRREQALDLA